MNKKLAILAIACTVFVILGGIDTTVLFGTQYLTTQEGYFYTVVGEAVSWWNCNWSYAKKITIDHTKVQSSQTNFPVLLYESSDADLAAHAQSDGGDIVFVDSFNLTQYDHELEKYVSSTGELWAWVEISSLSSSSDTILYMYYGNPDCADQWNIAGTWDSNFRMVQHLEETSDPHEDSTSYNNDGNESGGVNQSATGKIDGADWFDGSDDYIDCGTSSSLNITGDITLEAWVMDPPRFSSEKSRNPVTIVDKKDEHLTIPQGNTFIVKRTVSAALGTEVVFAALFSPGVRLNDMTIEGSSVFAGIYDAGMPNSKEEQDIEDIRKKLPDKLKKLGTIAYSKPFRIEDETTIQMQFITEEWYKLFSDGSISYLVFSTDKDYDFEGTTHWHYPVLIDWFNPFSIFQSVIDFFTGGDNQDSSDGIVSDSGTGIPIIDADKDSVSWENRYARLEVYPHTSRNIARQVQYANVTWKAPTADIDLAFRFDDAVSKPNIWIERYMPHRVKVSDYGWINSSYTIYNITEYTVINEPDEVYFGDMSSNTYINVTTTWDRMYEMLGRNWALCGFDGYEQLDDTTIRFNYTYWGITGYHYETQYWWDWVSLNDKFDETTYQGKKYYYVSNVKAVQGESHRFKWEYHVPPNTQGKWELFAKLHSDTIQGALESGRYVMIDPWWSISWAYRKLITINSSKVEADLTNFPVLVYNSSDNDLAARAQSDGDDIAFIDWSDNTTQLNHEIELFNGTTGELWAWVNVTSLSSTSDTKIWMYYGNSSCGSQENVAGTWDSNFRMVQHLEETSDPHEDSTSYNNDGNESGGVNQSATGKIDGADNLDGNNDRINLGNIGTLSNNTFSISVWVKVPNASPRQEMVWGAVTGTSDERFRFEVYDTWINFHDDYNMDTWTSSGTIQPDNWYHVVGTYDYPNQIASIYLDGEFKASDTSFSQASNALGGLQIGSKDGYYYLNGVIDEVRISNIARNASWIKASFHTQNQTTGFITWGSEQTVPTQTGENPVNGSTGIGVAPALNVTVDDADDDTLTAYWYSNSSGSWALFATNSSIDISSGSVNIIQTNSNFSNYSITYYWSVNLTDGANWNNVTYHFTTICANKEIISKGQNAYSLEINQDVDTLYGYINTDHVVQTSIDTNWHYVAFTFDGDTLTLYKDGESKDTTGWSGSIPTNANNLILGKNLSGKLDELRISSTARSAAWINTTYQNTNSPTTFATFGSQIGILTTWSYRKKIWINASMIDEDLTNFPVLISTTDTDLKNNALSNGSDILFTNSSVSWATGSHTDKLNHEIEKYDSSTGELVAWVNVTSLSSTTNTTLYMYYGNSLCTSNRQNATGVWDSNYVGVWHLNETVTDEQATGTHYDSTSNNNGAQDGNDETAGKIANGQVFDADDYIDVAGLSAPTDKTFTLWIYANALTNDRYETLIEFADDLPWFGVAAKWIDLYNEHPYSSTQITTGQWYHVAYTSDSGTDTSKIYIDGSENIEPTSDQTANTDTGSGMGIAFHSGDLHFRGIIDEVRISNIARNSSWISTSYYTMNDPGNFTAFGSQEIQNVAPVLSNPSPSDGATGQELNPTLSIMVNDTNVDSMDVTFRTNAGGTWGDIGSNNSVGNGTYSQTPSNMNSYNTTYYWSVNCTDGTAWTNSTYYFTTKEIHTYVVDDNDAQGYKGSDDNDFQYFSGSGGESEFSAGNYSAIDEDDSNYVWSEYPGVDIFPYHRFNFTIQEEVSSIIDIKITWKGYAYDGDLNYGHSLCVYETSSYVEKTTGTSSSKETLSVTYTSNFNSIIISGNLKFGVTTLDNTRDNGGIYSYYAEVNVTYTP